MNTFYHGIIINASQKDKFIFKKLRILGYKKRFLGIIKIFKVEISEDKITQVL